MRFLLVIFLVLIGCIGEEQISCQDIYSPVCGNDGKTYSNECNAKNNGVSIDYSGECANCKETDNGKDAYNKGITNDAMDRCLDRTYLLEFYCDGKTIKNETIRCDLCESGTCIDKENAAGNCVDTDGNDIYEVGLVREYDNIFEDRCEGEKVREYYCDNGFATYKIVECPKDFSCKDSICARTKIKCTDSDNGNDIYNQGIVVIDTLIDAEYIDKCIERYKLREYYCFEDELVINDTICPKGYRCLNAKCVVDV